MSRFALGILAAPLLAAPLAILDSCAAAKSDAAESVYLGQQLACVDEYVTKVAIDDCRRKVKTKWGRSDAPISTVQDSGDEK